MPSSPSTDDTRDACRKLLGAPRLRAAVCHYCGIRADTGGPITLSVQGWDLTPAPRGGRHWRCPACRAEDEGPLEVLVIPVRVEPAPRPAAPGAGGLCAWLRRDRAGDHPLRGLGHLEIAMGKSLKIVKAAPLAKTQPRSCKWRLEPYTRYLPAGLKVRMKNAAK